MTAPDLSTYHAIHTALRRGTRALAMAAPTVDPTDRARTAALARYWAGYAGEVLAHHTIEDDIFFPALVARVPVARELIARTDADHEHLDDLMDEIGAGMVRLQDGDRSAPAAVAAALAALADHMDTHLAFEDADILPLFSRHFTGPEYEGLDEQAKKALPIGKQAAFTVAFVAHWLDDEDTVALLASAPFAFKALLWATRRRHERLTGVALGAASDRTAVAAAVAGANGFEAVAR